MSYCKIVVTAGAKRESVVEKGNALQIAVKEPAQGNHANTRVREIIAARYGVPLAAVRIVSGHHSLSKMLSVRDA